MPHDTLPAVAAESMHFRLNKRKGLKKMTE